MSIKNHWKIMISTIIGFILAFVFTIMLILIDHRMAFETKLIFTTLPFILAASYISLAKDEEIIENFNGGQYGYILISLGMFLLISIIIYGIVADLGNIAWFLSSGIFLTTAVRVCLFSSMPRTYIIDFFKKSG